MSKRCLTCYYFDSVYHNGYCDKYHHDTDPDDECDEQDDYVSGRTSSETCEDCQYFDPNFKSGYCDWHRVETYSGKSCSAFTAK
jgi:hypothetical protein